MHLCHHSMGNDQVSFASLYVHTRVLPLQETRSFSSATMSRGSGSGKGLSFGSAKGGRKGPPIVWDDVGSLGPDYFGEAVYEFPVQSKHDFTKDKPLRGYTKSKEDWPKCMHGEDCLVQMNTSDLNGGRRFFKCPRAWVNVTNNPQLIMLVLVSPSYSSYLI